MSNPYAAPAPPPEPRPTNVLAVITLITGILGFAIVPIVLGHISLSQINRTSEGGRTLAIVGLVLGYLALAAYVILIVIMIGGVIWAVNA